MKLLLNKFLWAFLNFFIGITLVFFLSRLGPGDPAELILGPLASEGELLALKVDLGLNLSLLEQYFNFLKGLLRGELGVSLFTGEKVVTSISNRVEPTFVIGLVTISLSTFLGTFFGAVAAFFHFRRIDLAMRTLGLLLLSVPIFSLGPILIMIFSIWLRLLPVSGWENYSHLVLPCLTLALPLSAILMRVVRIRILEEKNELWITVLNAKGLPTLAVWQRIIYAILPTIFAIIALQLSIVLGGTIITENIFDIPGLGSLLLSGLEARDYPVIQGVVTYLILIYFIVYNFFDYLSSKIDPRIKF